MGSAAQTRAAPGHYTESPLPGRLGLRTGPAAAAVETAVIGASPARGGDAALERPARAEEPHGGVVGRDPGLGGEVLHGGSLDLDALQRRGVFGLERAGEFQDAAADLALGLGLGCRGLVQRIEISRGADRARPAAVVVGERVAQQAEEPGDGRFVLAHVARLLDALDEG